MAEFRLVVETKCEECSHFGPHESFSNPWYAHRRNGGSRRILQVDYEAAIDAAKVTPRSDGDGWDGWLLPVRRIIDAALGIPEETKPDA